jgi:PilZ domain
MDGSADASEIQENLAPENEQEEPGRERRRHPRYSCDGNAEVHLPHAGLLFHGRIQNLSVSGCYIETELNLERGTYVEVFFGLHQLRFRLAGNVIGVDRRSGVRIAFLNVTGRRATYIEELMRELAEKSEV